MVNGVPRTPVELLRSGLIPRSARIVLPSRRQIGTFARRAVERRRRAGRSRAVIQREIAESRAADVRARTSREFRPPQVETVRLEKLETAPVRLLFSPTLSPKVRAIQAFESGNGLQGARLQRFENLKVDLSREKSRLDAQAKSIAREQASLSQEISRFNAEQKRLQRLANNNLLQAGVATKNRIKGQKLNKQVQALNKKSELAASNLQTFNQGVQSVTRIEQRANIVAGKKITPITTTPVSVPRFERPPTRTEVRERLAFPREEIVPTREELTRRAIRTGEEFEQFFTGLRPVGQVVGGVSEVFGIGLRGVGAIAETGIGVVEQVTGDPFSFKVTLPKEVASLVSGLEAVPIIGEPFRGVGVRRVSPTATELRFGKTQAARAAVALAETELLLGFPLSKTSLKTLAGLRKAAKAPKPFVPTAAAEEFAVLPTISRRAPTLETVTTTFARLQKPATQAELERLILGTVEPVRRRRVPASREAIEFGGIVLPRRKPITELFRKTPEVPVALRKKKKPKRTIVIRFPDEIDETLFDIGERGALLAGRQRLRRPPRQRQLTLELPDLSFLDPIRIPVQRQRLITRRAVRLEDLLLEPTIPRTARLPRTAAITGFGLASAAAQALSQRELQSLLGISRQALEQLQRTERLQRVSEATAQRQRFSFASLLGTRSAQASRQAQRQQQRLREAEILTTRQLTRIGVSRPRERLTTKRRVRRARRAARVPPLIPLLPTIEFDDLLGRPRKIQGFKVRVKSGKKFRVISKKPLSEGTAKGLGSSFVDRGVERTFDIFPVKGKAQSIPELETSFNAFKFRRPRGKTKLPRQAFVERSAFAIDTPTELAGITFKGLLGIERNRRIRKILNIPKKRRRKVKKIKRRR